MLIWDYKTKLQEYCQSEKNSVKYTLISTDDYKHERQFLVEVSDLLGKFTARGFGKTKKKAEQEAAYKAMKELKLPVGEQ